MDLKFINIFDKIVARIQGGGCWIKEGLGLISGNPGMECRLHLFFTVCYEI